MEAILRSFNIWMERRRYYTYLGVLLLVTLGSCKPQETPALPETYKVTIDTGIYEKYFISDSGSFRSPNYPEAYSALDQRVWKIEVPEGHRVLLRFKYFDIEESDLCKNDFVKILDGHETDSPVLGKFCGNGVPGVVFSTKNRMTVEFKSDGAYQKTGFFAYFKKYTCGSIFNSNEGGFSSPNYPEGYNSFEDCIWKITVAEGHRVYLQLSSFDIESSNMCKCDSVKVLDGHELNSPVLTTFCGTRDFGAISSSENKLAVVFTSDHSIEGSGFYANFSTADLCENAKRSSSSNWKWHAYQHSCYMFSSEKFTWSGALAFCQENGGSLASIHSMGEQDFLHSLVGRNSAEYKSWIGMIFKSHTVHAKWIDGTPVDFEYFNDKYNCERCLSLDKITGLWTKTKCNTMLPAICEFKETHETSITPVSTTPGFPGYCPDDWYSFGEKCYRLFGRHVKDRETWMNAEKKCIENCASLVSIHYPQEQEFLTLHMMNIVGAAWIGLNRSTLGNEFQWTDHSSTDFWHWYWGEPNNLEHQEGCVEMWTKPGTIGKWNDLLCVVPRAYICQMDKDPMLEEPGRDPAFCTEPEQWSHLGLSCYHTFDEIRLSWFEAQAFCKNFDGNLATIKDLAISEFMRHNLSGTDELFWIGMSSKDDKAYNWIGTPSLDYFNNWLYGSPQTALDTDKCVAVDSNGKWLVKNCNENHPFICEVHEDDPEISFKNTDLECPQTSDKWKDLGGQFCYTVEWENLMTWKDAKTYCESKGGTLAIFHTMDELSVLTSFMKDIHEYMYIGLERNTNGTWSWIDGSAIDYDLWFEYQSFHTRGDCAILIPRYSAYLRRDCNERRGFVCSTMKVPRSQSISLERPT